MERSDISKNKLLQVKGVNSHFTKYSEEQILKVWELINTTELSNT